MTPFTLNLIQGSVQIKFSPEAAKNLQQEISTLMQSLKTAASQVAGRSGKPQPQPSMEYQAYYIFHF